MVISRLFLPYAIRRRPVSALLGLMPFARRGFSMKGKSPLFIPDRIEEATGWIPRGAAIRRYCLDEDDLKGMEHMEKPNPYMPSSNEAMKLYRHHDVFAKAMDKYGSLEAVTKKAAEDHRKLVEWLHSHSAPAKVQKEAPKDRRLPARLDVWARTLTSNPGSSEKVVMVAIMGNFAVSLSKLMAFWFTGSASMLSEAVHSVADLANQCLLAVGLSESNKTPDALHPYGYASEKYVWALISGVGIFFLGCGVSLYHGILGIIHPSEIAYHPITPAVLGFSFLVEGATFMVALKEIKRAAKQLEMDTWQYIRRGPDPNTVAVLAEDAAAVCGIVVASGCIAATHITGLGIFDAVGSIAVGGLLGVVAMFLIRKNHEYLLGRSIHQSYTEKVLRILHESKVISSVHDVKAVFLGPDAFRFKAEIVVNGQTLSRLFLAQQHSSVPNAVDIPILILPRTQAELETTLIEFGDHLVHFLGDEIDQIEAEIKRAVPEIKHVDLEII